MVDIITDADLAAYLKTDVDSQVTLIVEKTNALITEAWATPVTPVPTSVWAVAINVAARAMSNPKGLTSTTESWDDIAVTDRWEGSDALRQLGLYLTAEDMAALNGAIAAHVGVGTIQTPVRRDVCPPVWSTRC